MHKFLKPHASFLCVFFLCFFSASLSSKVEIGFSNKHLDADYDFLPAQDSSFEQSSIDEFNIAVSYSKFYLGLEKISLLLEGTRDTFPKNVDVDVDEEIISLGYIINSNLIKVSSQSTSKLSQSFDCYTFQTLTLGSCAEADLSITSSSPIYSELAGDLIKIEGETSGYAIEYVFSEAPSNLKWIADSMELALIYNEYNYDWLTPLEAIKSNFLLNLNFGGITLGEALNNEFARLPQRDQWETFQLRVRSMKDFYFNDWNDNVGIHSEIDLNFISYQNYSDYKSVPSNNFKLKLGLFLRSNNVEFMIFGEYFQNNLLGYHPIVLNQRTESRLSNDFGQLGISFKLLFGK